MSITEKEFLLQGIEWGISADNPAFVELARKTAEQIDIPVKTVLDYGAGTGVYANEFKKLGYDVSCYEIWDAHRDYIKQHFDLNIVSEPFNADLLVMIEVAEHMTNKEISDLFTSIKCPYLLFSGCNTTSDKDEYWGHINVKSTNDWHDMLKIFGYEILKKVDYPTDHTFIYKRF